MISFISCLFIATEPQDKQQKISVLDVIQFYKKFCCICLSNGVSGGMDACQDMHMEARDNFQVLLSPSTLWAPGIKFRLPDLVASDLSHLTDPMSHNLTNVDYLCLEFSS